MPARESDDQAMHAREQCKQAKREGGTQQHSIKTRSPETPPQETAALLRNTLHAEIGRPHGTLVSEPGRVSIQTRLLSLTKLRAPFAL